MEFITSRSYKFPIEASELNGKPHFHMWKRKQFPYRSLLSNDTLYWYETNSQFLKWQTTVKDVVRFHYSAKSELLDRFPEVQSDRYFHNGPESGYFIRYVVAESNPIRIPKPQGFRFPQQGWMTLDEKNAQLWFGRQLSDDITSLDDCIDTNENGSIANLAALNEKMKDVQPERVNQVIATTLRKDRGIVQALKKASDYKCQFNNCGYRILKKDGGYYIEVAHIKAVSEGGASVLGNLLVLCPNHHKEFDHGKLEIESQQSNCIKGKLNGKPFKIASIDF